MNWVRVSIPHAMILCLQKEVHLRVSLLYTTKRWELLMKRVYSTKRLMPWHSILLTNRPKERICIWLMTSEHRVLNFAVFGKFSYINTSIQKLISSREKLLGLNLRKESRLVCHILLKLRYRMNSWLQMRSRLWITTELSGS